MCTIMYAKRVGGSKIVPVVRTHEPLVIQQRESSPPHSSLLSSTQSLSSPLLVVLFASVNALFGTEVCSALPLGAKTHRRRYESCTVGGIRGCASRMRRQRRSFLRYSYTLRKSWNQVHYNHQLCYAETNLSSNLYRMLLCAKK